MKPVLIIENSNNALSVNENASTKDSSKVVMDGVFTEFSVTNRNNRIYTADEFVPHVDEMMSKKEWGVIYGEYDHPDVFDVSMKYVSHVVENAWYNEENNRVDGQIRLLSTHYGKDAKSLVDDGMPIFVSSRAAGITEGNGHVKLKQLFTYDIVADPGFSSAKMNVSTMNESLGFDTSNSLGILEANKNDMAMLSEKYNKSANITNANVFDLTDESKTNELFEMNKNDMVTKKQLADWSKHLISEMRKNNANITSMVKESKDIKEGEYSLPQMIQYQENMQEQFEKVIGYLDYLSEKVSYSISSTEVLEKKTEEVVEYTEYLAENLDKNIKYSNYLAENLDKNITYGEYLAESIDKTIDYTNYLAESLDKTIDYGEYIAESLSTFSTNSIKYSNYIAESLDKTIDYSNYIAENLDTNIGYATYIADSLDVNIGYTEYLAENISSTINYQDYLSECIDKTMDYSSMIAEALKKGENTKLNESILTADEYLLTESKKEEEAKETEEDTKEEEESCDKDKTVEEEEEKAKDTEEKENFKDMINDEGSTESLSEKLTKLIEEAKKREASKDEKPNFLSFLNPNDVKAFENLTNEQQEEIKVAINESTGYFDRRDVLTIMHKVLESDQPSDDELLLQGMPEDIKPVWEQLDNKAKAKIMNESKLYKTNSTELVNHFWSTRKLDKFLVKESKSLIESSNPFEDANKISDVMMDNLLNKFGNL